MKGDKLNYRERTPAEKAAEQSKIHPAVQAFVATFQTVRDRYTKYRHGDYSVETNDNLAIIIKKTVPRRFESVRGKGEETMTIMLDEISLNPCITFYPNGEKSEKGKVTINLRDVSPGDAEFDVIKKYADIIEEVKKGPV